MTKKILLFTTLLLSTLFSFAQKGDIWPTFSRQEFDISADGQILNEYQAQDYNSYYIFINNNEIIHCTSTITSLYKIINRNVAADYTDYTVVSEVGNQYVMRFNKKEKYVIITSVEKLFSVYIACYAPYNTKVFDNLNR